MKKIIVYTTCLLLLTIITVSGTYAYFAASTESKNPLATTSNKFEVIYHGGSTISGPLTFRSSRDENNKTTINIAVSNDSVLGKANVYIKIEEIDERLAETDVLIWEVYDTTTTNEKLIATGDFMKCGSTNDKKCEKDDLLYIVENHQLSPNATSYTIYVWLNGEIATNEVVGAKFKGYIGAESENFTANLK